MLQKLVIHILFEFRLSWSVQGWTEYLLLFIHLIVIIILIYYLFIKDVDIMLHVITHYCISHSHPLIHQLLPQFSPNYFEIKSEKNHFE